MNFNTHRFEIGEPNLMEPSWPETLLPFREKAIEELAQGHEFAERLKILLDRSMQHDGSISREDLAERVLNSFANSLSILSGAKPVQISHQTLENGSGESETKSFSKPRCRRGCHQRRKNRSDTWTREDTVVEDGHTWRKYGQKDIVDAKHPRSYFRCTYSFDQSCPAIKHVQQIQDNPPIYRTTYSGHHTCRNFFRPSQQSILDRTEMDGSDSSFLIRFDQQSHHHHHRHNQFFSAVNQENWETCVPVATPNSYDHFDIKQYQR